MYHLSCADGYAFVGLGDGDVFVLDVLELPSPNGSSGLVSISSDQTLSLFDLHRTLRAGPTRSVSLCHGNVTAMRLWDSSSTGSGQGSLVCTAGENGTAAVWDVRVPDAKAEVMRIAASTDQTGTHPIMSLACSTASHSIAVGTELVDQQASVYIWDVRATATPKTQYHEIHSDDITELRFHPANPSRLLTGSTDGLVNVVDVSVSDEDEAVVQTFNHGASVHRAGWLNADELFALSHDERFAVYDTSDASDSGAAATDFGDARPLLNCQYVANVFPKLAGGASAVIGAGAQDRESFELIHMTKGGASWTLDKATAVYLPGAHGSEIVRSFCVLDAEQVVFTAGEDGCIKAWKPPT